jgi:aspartate racemase
MAGHIGIVACSYEGAALCYQTICNEGSKLLGEHAHPEVSLHNHPLSEYMKYITTGDWEGVAGLMLSSSQKLAKCGADFLISPDNTIHQSFHFVNGRSPLPWLHIGGEVAREAVKKGYQQLLVLGTRFLMEGPVYPDMLLQSGLGFMIPAPDQRARINSIIFNELVYGMIRKESKEYFLSVIEAFRKRGCDAVVLGCTEIPLLIMPGESSLPVLDSTRILARAALKYSLDIK